MVEIDNTSAEAMRNGFVDAPDINPCPFCGKGFLKPPEAVSPIVFHPGVVTDGQCVLSGQGFREHQFELLNARAPQVERVRNPEQPDEVAERCR